MWLVSGVNSGHPVMVVKYEDLVSDEVFEVKRMLEFLDYRIKEEELRKRLESDRFDAFRRYKINAHVGMRCLLTCVVQLL